jgi:hypothetical protein
LKIFVVSLGAVAALAGCAAPPAPATLSAPMTAVPTTATVAAVRAETIGPQDGAALGANAVLAGLRQPALRQPASATEIVIVKQDGNAASITAPPAGLAPGAHVAVMNAATTSLVLQN